jgi:transcriptional regulator with XRE-family HTH domain
VINRRGRKEKPLTNSQHRVSPLSAALRAWRTYRGLSQTQLAVQAGFGQNGRAHISSIELGKIQRPEEETLDKIAAALGLQAEDLRSGCMPPDARLTPKTKPSSQQNEEHASVASIGGFGFRSPLRSRRWRLREDEQLQQILITISELQRVVEELQRMVETFIAQKRSPQ